MDLRRRRLRVVVVVGSAMATEAAATAADFVRAVPAASAVMAADAAASARAKDADHGRTQGRGLMPASSMR